MGNLNIIFVNHLPPNQKLVSIGARYSDKNMMILTGKQESNFYTEKSQINVCLNKNSFNTIFLFTAPEGHLKIGLNKYVLKSNDLVIIPEQTLNHSSQLIENKGYCIHFKTEYLLPFFEINRIEDILPFAENETKYVTSLTSDQSKVIKVLFEEINREYYSLSENKDDIIRCYIEILLLKSKECFQANSPAVHLPVNRPFTLTIQFKTLVKKNFLNIRTVLEYANILHVSPKHLEKTVKETLGITPKKLIHGIVLLEAKVLLKQTEKTVSEIAHDLKFQDQSYFSRFFKKHTSLTPLDFRNK